MASLEGWSFAIKLYPPVRYERNLPHRFIFGKIFFTYSLIFFFLCHFHSLLLTISVNRV